LIGFGYTIEDSISEDGQVVGGEVVFSTAPGGVSIIIGRRTSLCEPLVNYVPGASIRASDLNLSNDQLLNLIQETRSILGFMINPDDPDAPIVPGTGIELDDLSDVNIGRPPNPDPSTDAWVANNASFATTSASDNRYLSPATNDVIGGPGIEVTEANAQVTVGVDLAPTSGLEFTTNDNSGQLAVGEGNGITVNPTSVSVTPGLGIESDPSGVSVKLDPTDPGLSVTANGLQTFGNQTGIGTVQFGTGDTYTFPATDGNANTVLSTDGAGNLSWQNFSISNPLEYMGTVDLTSADPPPTPTANGQFWANTTAGTVLSAPWPAVSDLTTGQAVGVGNIMLWNGTIFTFVPTTGGAQDLQQVTDLGSTTTNIITAPAVNLPSGDSPTTGVLFEDGGNDTRIYQSGSDINFKKGGVVTLQSGTNNLYVPSSNFPDLKINLQTRNSNSKIALLPDPNRESNFTLQNECEGKNLQIGTTDIGGVPTTRLSFASNGRAVFGDANNYGGQLKVANTAQGITFNSFSTPTTLSNVQTSFSGGLCNIKTQSILDQADTTAVWFSGVASTQDPNIGANITNVAGFSTGELSAGDKNYGYYVNQDGFSDSGKHYSFYSAGTAPAYHSDAVLVGGGDTLSTTNTWIKKGGDANFSGNVTIGQQDNSWYSGNFNLGVIRGMIVASAVATTSMVQRCGNNTNNSQNAIIFQRSRGGSITGGQTTVTNNTNLGSLEWQPHNGTDYQFTAGIKGVSTSNTWTPATTKLNFAAPVYYFGVDFDNTNDYCQIDDDGVTIPTGKKLKLVDITEASALGTDVDGNIVEVTTPPPPSGPTIKMVYDVANSTTLASVGCSITVLGTGSFRIDFNSALTNTDYLVQATTFAAWSSGGTVAAGSVATVYNKSTSSCEVRTGYAQNVAFTPDIWTESNPNQLMVTIEPFY